MLDTGVGVWTPMPYFGFWSLIFILGQQSPFLDFGHQCPMGIWTHVHFLILDTGGRSGILNTSVQFGNLDISGQFWIMDPSV